MYHIETMTSAQGQAMLAELVTLLQDAVASGASIGFLPPLSDEAAREYWADIFMDIEEQHRILLVACHDAQVVGSVQLELATKPNAQHRAEVQKLCVLQRERRHGIGRLLMEAVEPLARQLGRTLLVLDTRVGDDAERLYRRLHYNEGGIIPAYARNAEGTLDATIIFYKQLTTA